MDPGSVNNNTFTVHGFNYSGFEKILHVFLKKERGTGRSQK